MDTRFRKLGISSFYHGWEGMVSIISGKTDAGENERFTIVDMAAILQKVVYYSAGRYLDFKISKGIDEVRQNDGRSHILRMELKQLVLGICNSGVGDDHLFDCNDLSRLINSIESVEPRESKKITDVEGWAEFSYKIKMLDWRIMHVACLLPKNGFFALHIKFTNHEGKIDHEFQGKILDQVLALDMGIDRILWPSGPRNEIAGYNDQNNLPMSEILRFYPV